MTMPRFILKTDFSFEKMSQMEEAEARKYYITNFFVPVAYEMISADPHDSYAALLIGAFMKVGTLTEPTRMIVYPIFDKVDANILDGYYSTAPLKPTPNMPTPVIDGTYIKHFERISGGPLDIDKQSEQLTRAFGKCWKAGIPVSPRVRDCPMIATLSATTRLVDQVRVAKLNVLVKDRTRVHHVDELTSHAASRTDALVCHPKYDYRTYNKLTGEWFGLCDPSSPNCCASCKKIFASPAAENAYHDEQGAL